MPKGEEANEGGELCSGNGRKLLLFSGNDYLGLSAHPTIRMAAAKVILIIIVSCVTCGVVLFLELVV